MASAGLCQPNRPEYYTSGFKSYMENLSEMIHQCNQHSNFFSLCLIPGYSNNATWMGLNNREIYWLTKLLRVVIGWCSVKGWSKTQVTDVSKISVAFRFSALLYHLLNKYICKKGSIIYFTHTQKEHLIPNMLEEQNLRIKTNPLTRIHLTLWKSHYIVLIVPLVSPAISGIVIMVEHVSTACTRPHLWLF